MGGIVSRRDFFRAAAAGAADRYLVGLQRRRNPTAQAVLAAATGPWQPLPEGGAVAEVRLPDDPVRYVVVRSPERLRYEREMRRQEMRRCRDRLREFQQTVARGRLRAPEKIGARVQTILTNDPSLDALQAVAAYKDLQAVERVFRALKDVLGCALEKALRQARLQMALDVALEALHPVRLVTLELDGAHHRVITKPTPHALAVLKAVGLRHLERPEGRSEIA